jgi:hypothetical protein
MSIPLSRELSSYLIEQAMLAPSTHNSQPWRFVVSDDAIELWADRERVLPFNDPVFRELTISCGCALLNMRAAAEGEGLYAQPSILPDAEHPDLLARVRFVPMTVEHHRLDLVDSILLRRTYRKCMYEGFIGQDDIASFVNAAADEHAQLRPFFAKEEQQELESLAIQADSTQWADVDWRRAVARWMKSHEGSGEARLLTLVLPISRNLVKNSSKPIEPAEQSMSPLWVLTTETDSPVAWLSAGQALERVLLMAAKMGLQANYLNQTMQVDSTRPKLAKLLQSGLCPQILFRLGKPTAPPSAQIRRPLADVTTWTNVTAMP